MINAPVSSPGEEDYMNECVFALEPSFHGLIASARDSGWELCAYYHVASLAS